jgi:sialic acid synthase SpsE
LLIAEIGQNHQGNMTLATHLIDEAKKNGAGLCKFQLYDSTVLYGHKQDTELSKQQAVDLFQYGKEIDFEVFFSVFDIERVKWCEEMGVTRYKVAYSQRNNTELIDCLVETGKPIWVSGVNFYCIPKYPTELNDLHFNNVDFINQWHGYSDHTIGLHAAKIAIARGCPVVEKHFAIDHKTGVDALWSANPAQLAVLSVWEDTVNQCAA